MSMIISNEKQYENKRYRQYNKDISFDLIIFHHFSMGLSLLR